MTRSTKSETPSSSADQSQHLNLNGLHIEVSNLHELLDALADHMMAMDHYRDGKLDTDMQRATALASIGRDIAGRLVDDVQEMF